jgi:hypothetical protein
MHPSKTIEKVIPAPVPISNKQTRTQRKDYSKYDDSEEEVYEPASKR